MRLSDLEKQLINKKKDVAELANLIALRTDRNPNFSILLGAGCSVSSGIKSASSLISEWRSSFCNGITGVEEQKNYLKQNHPDWYDPNKEYSSLFERKFDLQRQRRMFVEREVARRTPSIGYAYLTSLIKDDYFHTLFTTNFDDLINEAFYLYSDQRPIVCAHDSSINSITVTSSRPKIIKLHGDYLFDDIKATARETESLEQNMKAKFTEFAKDFGLIVVGYSGCDRSIMDVISVLLKNDAYFKNGIYWCLRKNSEISDDLKKLLWKDKVYFVEIEGFDEMFAEIHSCYNNEGAIPISTSSITRRPTEIISKLLGSQNFSNSTSPILRKAYDQLSKESKRTTLMDLILPRDKDETNNSKEQLSDDELITRFELKKLYSAGDYREVIEKGRSALQLTTKPSIRQEIFRSIISAYKARDELREAVTVVDELIAEQPYLASHYLAKADLMGKHQEKLESINKAIEVNPYWFRGHYRKAILFFNLAAACYGKDQEDAVSEAIKAVDDGLKRDPSLENPCWDTKFRLVTKYEKENASREAQQKKIIENLNEMNPESGQVLSLRMSMLSSEKNQAAIKSLIAEIDKVRKKSSPSNRLELDAVKLEGLQKLDDIGHITTELEAIKGDCDLASNIELVVPIAEVLRNKLGKDNEALELLRSAYDMDNLDQDVVEALIEVLIDTGELSEAESVFSKTSNILTSSNRFNLKLHILDEKGDFDGALAELRKRSIFTGVPNFDNQPYYLIKNKNYVEAEKLLRGFLESINFSPEATVQIVNYELACKRQKTKVDHNRLEKVMRFDTSPQLAAAVYAILGKKNEMLENIRKAVNNDRTFRYLAKRWVVFDEYKADVDFTKALSCTS
jgi:hypothetical protein